MTSGMIRDDLNSRTNQSIVQVPLAYRLEVGSVGAKRLLHLVC